MSPASITLRDRDISARRPRCSPERSSRSARTTVGGPSQTLDDLMAGAWAGLQAGAPIACPLCDSAMEPRWSAGAGVVGGRCRGCGTELA